MILNRSISRQRQPASYSLSARQVRNACVIGCVGGMVFVALVCALI